MATSKTSKIAQAIIPVQKINQCQVKKMRDKDLYYDSNSKCNPGHKCQQPKLILIEEVEKELDEVPKIEEATSEVLLDFVTNPTNPKISLHTFIGSLIPKTMRIKGSVGNQEVVVLIDIGSTHNL